MVRIFQNSFQILNRQRNAPRSFIRMFGASGKTAPLAIPTIPNKREIVEKYRVEFDKAPDVEKADEFVNTMMNELRGTQKKNYTDIEQNELADKYVEVLNSVNYNLTSFRRLKFGLEFNKIMKGYNWFENEFKDLYELYEPQTTIYDEDYEEEVEFFAFIENLDEKTRDIVYKHLRPPPKTWESEEYQPSSANVNLFRKNPDVKAQLSITEEELNKVLNDEELLVLKKIAGTRYIFERQAVLISSEKFKTQYLNRTDVQVKLAKLILTSRDIVKQQTN